MLGKEDHRDGSIERRPGCPAPPLVATPFVALALSLSALAYLRTEEHDSGQINAERLGRPLGPDEVQSLRLVASLNTHLLMDTLQTRYVAQENSRHSNIFVVRSKDGPYICTITVLPDGSCRVHRNEEGQSMHDEAVDPEEPVIIVPGRPGGSVDFEKLIEAVDSLGEPAKSEAKK